MGKFAGLNFIRLNGDVVEIHFVENFNLRISRGGNLKGVGKIS